MVIVLIISVILNCVLFGVVMSLRKSPQTTRRRGYICTSAASDKRGTKYNIRALAEEVENLGTRSRVKYLEITGIDKLFHEQAAQILGTIIDHDRIEWIKPTPAE